MLSEPKVGKKREGEGDRGAADLEERDFSHRRECKQRKLP